MWDNIAHTILFLLRFIYCEGRQGKRERTSSRCPAKHGAQLRAQSQDGPRDRDLTQNQESNTQLNEPPWQPCTYYLASPFLHFRTA